MKAIMYHYVRQSREDLPYFKFLNIDDFNKQLDFFERQFGFVSKEDFLNSFNNGITPKGTVLTFDDGFKDHYKIVMPALKARHLWGIFYIPTNPLIKKKLLNVHRIHMLLGTYGGEKIFYALKEHMDDEMLTHKEIKEFTTRTYEKQDNDQYTKLVKRILNYYIGYEYQGPVILELMKELLDEKNIVEDFYVSENDIKIMQDEGMLIGSHTVNHPVMSKLSETEQAMEIKASFDYLESVTGGLNIRTFCYPYGGFHSFNEDSERILLENNCTFAFNVESRDINTDDLHNRPTALPRYDCNEFSFGQCR